MAKRLKEMPSSLFEKTVFPVLNEPGLLNTVIE
jgi:hypothetical protein